MAEQQMAAPTVPRRFLAVGLVLTLLFQLAVLAVEYLGSVWPLWFGSPVKLETVPIDPRSLFRGNYVRLDYAISEIDEKLVKDDFRYGEVGYVTLQQDGPYFVPTGLQRTEPAEGLFIRGRVRSVYGSHRMEYGIEAYFMPKDAALQTEREVAQGAAAEVYLLPSGRAAIARLLCDGGPCGEG